MCVCGGGLQVWSCICHSIFWLLFGACFFLACLFVVGWRLLGGGGQQPGCYCYSSSVSEQKNDATRAWIKEAGGVNHISTAMP